MSSQTAQPEQPVKAPRTKPFMSLSSVILLMMLLGAVTGLFFGELVGWMKELGNAVILLMQMTILPYIMVSLIGGLGKLSASDARSIFSKAGLALGLLWLVSLVFIFITPISFPHQETASFFSKALLPQPQSADFFQLYIPSNPFNSMASGAIPAVVLFSISVGIALIGVEKKAAVMEAMETLTTALLRVNKYVSYTLPVGVFASTAGAAGTLTLEQFGTLQVFLISFMVLSLLLTFLILPRLIATLAPFNSGEIIQLIRGALVTAFATGNIFIVIPELEKVAVKLFQSSKLKRDETEDMVAIMLPLAFSFPNAGKLMVLLFVPFAGWFSGKEVELLEYPMMALTGLLSLFGSIFGAIPLLLQSQQLPNDLFQLFIISNFITSKFISLVAVMHMMVFALLAVAAYQGQLKVIKSRLLLNLVLVGVLTIGALLGTRIGMDLLLPKDNPLGGQLMRMQVTDTSPEITYAGELEQHAPALPQAGFKGIQAHGVLRVGYVLRSLPFSYFNNQAELVGFDVALLNRLANELEVKLELIPFRRNNLAPVLEQNAFDIAIGGLELTSERIFSLGMTNPVLDMHLGLLTEDHRLNEFSSLVKIKEHEGFKLAVVGHRRLLKAIEDNYPNIEAIEITEYYEYLEKPYIADALLISAEEGYAWSILYPQYGVVLPKGMNVITATSYAVAKNRTQLLVDLNAWLTLQRLNGQLEQAYNFWILGEGAKSTQPRWSILRDVLGWID